MYRRYEWSLSCLLTKKELDWLFRGNDDEGTDKILAVALDEYDKTDDEVKQARQWDT